MMPSPSRSAAMLPGTAPGGGGGGGAAAISSCCEQAESASAPSAPSMRGWIRMRPLLLDATGNRFPEVCAQTRDFSQADRTSVAQGQSVSIRENLRGRSNNNKKKKPKQNN